MKQILIADDDPGIRDIFKLLLIRAGYAVTVCSTGEDLMEKNFELPDLFILDKQLSGIDGVEVCHFLKNKESTKNIPVILVSASPNVEMFAKEAGADNFMEKPFEVKSFLEMIAHYVNRN